jgi:hypothetical protein
MRQAAGTASSPPLVALSVKSASSVVKKFSQLDVILPDSSAEDDGLTSSSLLSLRLLRYF